MQKMRKQAPDGRGNPSSWKRLGVTMTLTVALVATPSTAAWTNPSAGSSPSPTASASPTPSETPSETPSPTTPGPSAPGSSGPSPSPSTSKPAKPGKPGAGDSADEQDQNKADDEAGKKKRKKKRKKKEKQAPMVDMAVVYAAAERQLATAEADLAGAKRELDEARRAQSAAVGRVQSLRNQAALLSPRAESQSTAGGLRGLSAGLIPTARPAESGGGEVVGAELPADPVLAEQLRRAEESRRQADQRVSAAESSYNLVRLNIDTARAVLGLAGGGTSAESAAKGFTDYPVGDCDFPGVKNPSGCREAQRWAIAQTINPMKNWFYLCLNFVTIAYGHGGGHPTAISHWNAVPESKRHSPNTVAPPGALMFWGPNHVALSLGNNVLVSVDVLGTGRAWIVDFATIQAVWGLPYLGWTEPDFSV